MVTWLQAPYLPQSRPEASKRPDSVPLSFPSTKRMRASASPPAQVEDGPVDCDEDQVSSPGGRGRVPEGASQGAPVTPLCPPQAALHLEPLHFLQCHSKNNSPKDLETQLWACAFEPAKEEGVCWASGHQEGRLGSHGGAQRETR